MLSDICVVSPSALWEGPILILCVPAFCTHIFFVNCKTGEALKETDSPSPPSACLAV